MRLTTVRVRPGRSDKLAELGVETVRGTRYLEVSVFGETVAVASVDEDYNAAITWLKEDLEESRFETFLEAYFVVVQGCTDAGIVPA